MPRPVNAISVERDCCSSQPSPSPLRSPRSALSASLLLPRPKFDPNSLTFPIESSPTNRGHYRNPEIDKIDG